MEKEQRKQKIKDTLKLIFLIIFYIPFVCLIPIIAIQFITFPKERIENTSGDTSSIIDSAEIFTAEEETLAIKSMQNFTDTTGVVFKFITMEYNVWTDESMAYSDYIQKLYDDHFEDEKGILITCAVEEYEDDYTFMLGQRLGKEINNIHGNLYSFISEHANNKLEKLPTMLVKASDKAVEDFENQKIEFNKDGMLIVGLVAAFVVVHGFLMFNFALRKRPLSPGAISLDEMIEKAQTDSVNDFSSGPETEPLGKQIKSALELLKDPEPTPEKKSFVGVDGECYNCKKRFENVTDGHCPYCKAPIKKDNICWE